MPHLRTTTVALALLVALAAPATSFAASARPSCSLSVTTPAGTVTTRKSVDVYAVAGETVSFAWESKNADSATLGSRQSVPTSGTSSLVASESADFAYKFKNGSRSATCTAELNVIRASIDEVRASENGPSSLTGEITGVKGVRVVVLQGDEQIFSGKAKVKRGNWRVSLREKFDDGTYDVVLYATERGLTNRVLAKSTFRVGAAQSGSLAASPVPLLFGGTARVGGSVPVAYVKLVNTGATPVSITGFDIVQSGSAPGTTINGFTTSDDKGGSLATIGGPGARPFLGTTAFVPLAATLAPGQLRIFTVKAMVDASAASYLGTQLKIDVTGVRTDASVTGVFPMRGTTWTLAR